MPKCDSHLRIRSSRSLYCSESIDPAVEDEEDPAADASVTMAAPPAAPEGVAFGQSRIMCESVHSLQA